MRMQILAARTSAWAAVAAQVSQLIEDRGFRLLKRNARTTAGFLKIDGEQIFVKRIDEGSWLKGWILQLTGSRARRVLRGAAILKAAGFARPEPLAVVEAWSMGAIRASYVISETLQNAHVMSEIVLAGGRRNFRRRCEVSGVIAKEVRRLHDAGVYTLDLQETNLMLSGGNGIDWKIHFVDLEDFRTAPTVSEERRMLNLVHLDRTIGRFLPRTQRLRFLYNYLGGRPLRAEARRTVSRFLVLRARAERRAHSRQRETSVAPPESPADSTAMAPLSRTGASCD